MGATRTKGNFLKATYDALLKTYEYLTPDLWGYPNLDDHPFEKYAEYLGKAKYVEE